MEIDYTKLSRDYEKNPLGRRESIPEEDLRYLYLDLLLPTPEITKVIGKKGECIGKHLKSIRYKEPPGAILTLKFSTI